MIMEFEHKTILVTGAGSGFGLQCAKQFAALGARIVAVDRQEQRSRETIASLESPGGARHFAIVRDLRPADAAKSVVAEAMEKAGGIDVLVSSAGVCHFNAIHTISAEEWDEVLEIDLRSLFFIGVAAAEAMKAAGRGGAIINLASNAARKGRALSAHYAAAKAGVVSVTESLALAYGPAGIRVNTVSPAVVVTDMWTQNFAELATLTGKTPEQLTEAWTAQTPLRRLGTPGDIANLIVFLAGPKAEFITGQHINVCGGFMHTC
jgi:NAD(P)-dependent dehydrogenase (short-subunit alcohol dehydrogenase family)